MVDSYESFQLFKLKLCTMRRGVAKGGGGGPGVPVGWEAHV